MEKNLTELWGIVTKVECSGGCYLVTIKQDKTNDNWEILVDSNNMQIDREDMEIGKHIYANGSKAKCAKNGLFCQYIERWGRYCSHCGKHHEEGYYSENTGIYACSDECLNALYTREEIAEERDAEWLFWTEWYN